MVCRQYSPPAGFEPSQLRALLQSAAQAYPDTQHRWGALDWQAHNTEAALTFLAWPGLAWPVLVCSGLVLHRAATSYRLPWVSHRGLSTHLSPAALLRPTYCVQPTTLQL